MEQTGNNPSKYGLEKHGIHAARRVFWNLSPAALVEQSLERNEGELTETGALSVRTGSRTGRSPKDKFIVQRSPSQEHIAWGAVNAPIEPARFDALRAKMLAHLEGRDLFVRDCFAGADPKYRMPIRVITECAWHNRKTLALHSIFTQRPAPLTEPGQDPCCLNGSSVWDSIPPSGILSA